jgi:hypothetical protein
MRALLEGGWKLVEPLGAVLGSLDVASCPAVAEGAVKRHLEVAHRGSVVLDGLRCRHVNNPFRRRHSAVLRRRPRPSRTG